MILLNPVVISVIVMASLCLLKLNVLLSILLAAITAGIAADIPIQETMKILIDGMGGNSETALSYILLGAFAIAVSKTGLATILARKISKTVKGNKIALTLIIAFVACFSQNLIPIHIAFIPILIPPLIPLMNKMKLDRRAVACALTFGLKAPYVTLPVGFGLIYHNIIKDQMTQNGIQVTIDMTWRSMWIGGLAMLTGLIFVVFIVFRKPREYEDIQIEGFNLDEDVEMTGKQWLALLAAAVAFIVQLKTKSLPLGALSGLIAMLATGSVKWKEIDEMIDGGLKMMALVAMIMLVAAGYANVLRQTGAIDVLVNSAASIISSKITGAIVMLLIGLLVTMGIGTSFGTIPILSAIYCPLGLQLGFSVQAIILLIGIASALGDAGSPASDSTLGPTSGLNIDGQHDHIWDTCVPNFSAYVIPLFIFAVIGSLML
ncbi:sodium:proton antiporter [Clostridium tetani]|uniref:Na+/H+ antiporter family protein n=1 Tax=Clostridium tetani TaxID=1513 RepID=UPI00100A591D|nr:SLC13 family permease [Clostridium tetani]RXM77020.1 sodium:proton antiporter [Clostridium tetani]RYU99264.1 sodium:proton antiporter [Clostridium tetani]